MKRHLIHRQVLDLHYTDEGRAKAAMNQWGERYQKEWLPIIEELLDELDSQGKWVRLEKVELDLGKIRENQSPEIFQKKLKEVLKTQLLRQIPELRELKEEQRTRDSRRPHDETKQLELLIFQLKYGRKPWWASHSKKEGIKNLIKTLAIEKNKDFLVWLQSEFFSQEMVERLINHLKHDEMQKILSFAFPEKSKESQIIVNSLVSALSPEIIPKNELEKVLGDRIVEAFLISEKQIDEPVSQWFKTWLLRSETGFRPTQKALTELLALLIPADLIQKSQVSTLGKVWSNWTQTPIFRNARASETTPQNFLMDEKLKFLDLVKNGKVTRKPIIGEDPKPSQAKTPKTEKLEVTETFPISNSGLVLAAPFLPFFFKGLGLVENKEFVSKEAQNRGILLIQSLLDESYSYEESDLLLNKILCGIAPSEPIQVQFSPKNIEKEEIKNLLDTMVARWTALKSTSGASMAKGFFPREGSLCRVDKGYQLTIPRISIDILLNRLPWTISIIKLPWMEETLYTEW